MKTHVRINAGDIPIRSELLNIQIFRLHSLWVFYKQDVGIYEVECDGECVVYMSEKETNKLFFTNYGPILSGSLDVIGRLVEQVDKSSDGVRVALSDNFIVEFKNDLWEGSVPRVYRIDLT